MSGAVARETRGRRVALGGGSYRSPTAVGVVLLAVVIAGAVAAKRAPAEPAHHMNHGPRGWMDGARAHAVPPPPPAPAKAAACPDGMLLVDGVFCPYVGHRCLEWIEEDRDRCRRYDETPRCEGLKRDRRFCIDRYEFPNQEGAYPAVMVSWVEAKDACAAEGKRLCTESEWTFACEGVEQKPYPYGFDRDPKACNIDRHYRDPDFAAFSDPWKMSEEVARLDQRVPSGSMQGCVSPFGVRDMTGNVDEWVVNEDPKTDAGEDVSGLKGGYWGPIRARCRPITNSHNRWFRFYQVGFRCCSDPRE